MTVATKRINPVVSILSRLGISVLILFFLYRQIDVEKTWNVVKTAAPALVLYAFGVYLLIYVILFLRWLVFVRALNLTVPLLITVRYYMIGMLGNLFLPSAIGGDLLKTVGVCRYTPQRAKVVASVLLDRLSGFGGMVVVATLAFVLGFRVLNDAALASSIMLMAVVSTVFTVVLFHEKSYAFVCRIFEFLPKLKQGLMSVHYDVVLLKDKRCAIYQAVAISCCAQLILALTMFLLGKALYQDIPLMYFLIFVPLICVASSLPSLGGLGTREAATVILMGKVGVDSGIAVSISLITYVFMVLAGFLGGLFYLLMTKPSDESRLSKNAAVPDGTV